LPQDVSDMSRTVSAAEMDAIVEAILDELGGVLGRDLLSSRDETGAEVAGALKNWIEQFQRWNFWHSREGRKILADHAKKLAERIAALERELDALPEPLAAFLFKPTAARRAVLPEDLLMAAIGERQALAEQLKQMRLACQAQKPPPLRLEPDRVKDLCAAFALHLMRAFSRRRSYSYGHHRAIAGLIYEALTGKVAELKRSCDRVRARTFRLRDRTLIVLALGETDPSPRSISFRRRLGPRAHYFEPT
jgi:hypothetical protein